MDFKPKFTFIVPLFDEIENLNILISRLNNVISKINEPCEIILVDDGSTDGTLNVLEELAYSDHNYHCIFLSRNFGHQRALSAGLDYSRGEVIMILDGDMQDPPELFFDFYEQYQKGYEIVYGIRKNRKEAFLKRFLYHLFYRILNKISNYPIPLDSGDFALLSRKVVNIITRMPEESRFLRGIRSWVGFNQIGIPYDRDFRKAGIPKYNYKKLFKLAYDGIFNFSVFPIKFLTYLGIICMTVSIIYFIITLIRKLILNDVPIGFTALLFMIILFGGIQLLSLGIIGEYVQRIFFQVKNRPLYIISKRIINGENISET